MGFKKYMMCIEVKATDNNRKYAVVVISKLTGANIDASHAKCKIEDIANSPLEPNNCTPSEFRSKFWRIVQDYILTADIWVDGDAAEASFLIDECLHDSNIPRKGVRPSAIYELSGEIGPDVCRYIYASSLIKDPEQQCWDPMLEPVVLIGYCVLKSKLQKLLFNSSLLMLLAMIAMLFL